MLVITVPVTCSVVVLIWNADAESAVVSGVVLKVTLLPGGGTVCMYFYF